MLSNNHFFLFVPVKKSKLCKLIFDLKWKAISHHASQRLKNQRKSRFELLSCTLSVTQKQHAAHCVHDHRYRIAPKITKAFHGPPPIVSRHRRAPTGLKGSYALITTTTMLTGGKSSNIP